MIVAIDPGKLGAIVILIDGEVGAQVFPMPIVKSELGRDEYDLQAIRRLFAIVRPSDHVVIEKLQPMPLKMGGSIANFNRGASTYLFIGLCLGMGIPYTMVSPRTWQREMLTKGSKDTKQDSILTASRLFPGVSLIPTPRSKKPSDGIADALLIAEWARRAAVSRQG
jgi:hypothetical protein